MNDKTATRIRKYCRLFPDNNYWELKKKYKSLDTAGRTKFNKDMILAINASKQDKY